MPGKKPPPFSPEGKRAAERIRTIFFSIAAANLVLVAIVMWQRHNAGKKPVPTELGVSPKKEATPIPAAPNKQP